jgi:hypothetical protein
MKGSCLAAPTLITFLIVKVVPVDSLQLNENCYAESEGFALCYVCALVSQPFRYIALAGFLATIAW